MNFHGFGDPLTLVLAFVIAALPCTGSVAAQPVTSVDELAKAARRHNPRIQAARDRLTQARMRRQGRSGFFDPQFTASAGAATRVRSLPGLTRLGAIPAEATVLNAAVDVPVIPGLYLGIGASERLLREPESADNALYQTRVGARLRVPLLRDRGFRQYDATLRRDRALVRQAAGALWAVMQAVQHDLEQRYLDAWEAAALVHIAGQATQRFETLLREAATLVDLGVTPAYQVYPATLELDLGRADELDAHQAHQVRLVELARLVGADDLHPSTPGTPTGLIDRAEHLLLDDYAAGTQVDAMPRGEIPALQAEADTVRADLELSRDALRSDLSLEVNATWQGEHPDDPLGSEAIVSDEHTGSEALLVWRRPLGFRTERGELQRQQARLEETRARIRDVRLQLQADRRSAHIALTRARERLAIVSGAVAAARKAVDSEEQRFRLGEGRSRDVLDAQKDLTAAIRRQARTAAEVLRAASDFRYAVGLNIPQSILEHELDSNMEGETP